MYSSEGIVNILLFGVFYRREMNILYSSHFPYTYNIRYKSDIKKKSIEICIEKQLFLLYCYYYYYFY